MANFVVLIILLVIVGSAVFYIRKAKKSGVQCIGCPEAGSCASKSGCGCSCHSNVRQK
ncbi:MAG: FeoB-associated Cys-rich membrane protein [Lachnospiraceae bacterium]|nr:FeoB-associated Cys-rich membrane protein [Lachnospiraceae bacterium]